MVNADTTKGGNGAGTSVKQAVIVIHGMGEQRPMETLRAFVGGLYAPTATAWRQSQRQRNVALPPSDTDSSAVMRTLRSTGDTILRTLAGTGNPAETDQYWIVPDARAGSNELSRIRTRPHVIGGRTYNTDFYELYYSDLLSGNTLAHFAGWVKGLLLRWPHQVPKAQVGLWVFLWIAAVVAVVLLGPELANSPVKRFLELWTGPANAAGPWPAVGASILGVVGIWLMVDRWRQHIDDPSRRSTHREISRWVSLGVAFLLPPVLAVLAYFHFPWGALWSATFLKLAFAMLMFYAIHNLGVRYFGDVARYVRTEPDFVAARAAVRERGLKLLDSVHGAKKRDANGMESDDPEYDRVIIVAHSLGSIIALDLLRLYFASKGPGQGKGVTVAESKALLAVDSLYQWAAAGGKVPEPPEMPSAFHDRQRQAAATLGTGSARWRITDFITLGSPLAHAEFLVARDRPRFEKMKAERMIPTCPPLQEKGIRGTSFLYTRPGEKVPRPHHAALFASVRFTAIYDPAQLHLVGDFIGGPVRPNFGCGVAEFPVAIRKPGLFGRVFTHTAYWDPRATARFVGLYNGVSQDGLPDGLAAAADNEESAHLAALRALIWLKDSRTGAIT